MVIMEDCVVEKKTQKRVNYTSEEKNDFLTILKKYPDLYKKKTDNKGIAYKRMLWKKVTNEFNRMEGHLIERTEDQLRKLWENLKSDHRKNLTKQKSDVFGSGVGIVTYTVEENPHMEVLLGNVDIELPNAQDSDTISLIKNTSAKISTPVTSLSTLSKVDEVEQDFHMPVVPSTSFSTPSSPDHLHARDLIKDEEEEIGILEEEVDVHETTSRNEDEERFQCETQNRQRNRDKVPKRAREAVIKDWVTERKKQMIKEHTWKEMEHQLRIKLYAAELEAAKAKKLYYDRQAMNNCK